MINEDLLTQVIKIAENASLEILAHYSNDIDVSFKSDESPVTVADLKANEYICAELKKITPDIAILSEENNLVSKFDSDYFWLVDPLDGTKEFINRNDEFTVNISLINDKKPILGVISLPARGVTYYAQYNHGAYKKNFHSLEFSQINVATADEILYCVVSRSHINQETENFIMRNNLKKIPAGSSLKFCVIAEGKAHFYPRLGRTMLWDIAAGCIILKEAGGAVCDLNGKNLIFDPSKLDNNYFLASYKKIDIRDFFD